MSAPALLIRNEIARNGPIPFRRFMELALYAPETGYYAGGTARVGRQGDFVTSVSVGPLFGRLLAAEFEAMWRRLGCPERFTVVEQGANGGEFARDVLGAASPEWRAALEYRIIEPFPALAARQRETLRPWVEAGRVSWSRSPETLPPFCGVHFSNELVDALPVHRVVRRGDEWREEYVGPGPGETFVPEEGPLSTPELAEALARLPSRDWPEGYRTEIPLAASRWLREIAARLERGYVLVADYGFSRADYYLPERRDGTLSAYYRQRREADPLARPGEQDLTAHVEFTSLAEAGLACGLDLLGFGDQHHYLVGLGRLAFPDGPPTPERQRDLRAFATLMHPASMGRGFRFLGLGRAAPAALPGFAMTPCPYRGLGLPLPVCETAPEMEK